MTYSILLFDIVDGEVRLGKVLANNLEEKANALFYWKAYCTVKAQESIWLVAVSVEVSFYFTFTHYPKMVSDKLHSE